MFRAMNRTSDFGRATLPNEPCVVCGESDARALGTTRLTTGELVAVCGKHELMHRRSPHTAKSQTELKTMLLDRRRARDRRGLPKDELGAQLTEAFSEHQRATFDRRRSG